MALGVLVGEELADQPDCEAEDDEVIVRLPEEVNKLELEPELVCVADAVEDRELVAVRLPVRVLEDVEVNVRVRVLEPEYDKLLDEVNEAFADTAAVGLLDNVMYALKVTAAVEVTIAVVVRIADAAGEVVLTDDMLTKALVDATAVSVS